MKMALDMALNLHFWRLGVEGDDTMGCSLIVSMTSGTINF
jgi:hypothetical protein